MNETEDKTKSVCINDTIYTVAISHYDVVALEYTYATEDRLNGYETRYVIKLDTECAHMTIECSNDMYACRGHKKTDEWTEASGLMDKKEAEQLIEKIKTEFTNAEDGTPDVHRVFLVIHEAVKRVETKKKEIEA